ncbi:hypothetical protein K466DRAFT_502435 [Polyporus arcularius HHB13444]|uniref:Uncharacterized protein n=1 Tax=Polyporus arcularius HHB13444 TaxID=1314778 RepID=A0A5C3NY14_9APHY|nr:hypothetical protein K466DRAFT_502435 [Polyporus arcularius HHB13444]
MRPVSLPPDPGRQEQPASPIQSAAPGQPAGPEQSTALGQPAAPVQSAAEDGSAATGSQDDSDTQSDIPGLSKAEHPLFARALKLPELPIQKVPSKAFSDAHDKWYIRSIIVLIAFLHTRHHVTFRACDITLFALRTIFVALDLIDKNDDMPATLKTAFTRLKVEDRFHVLPECSRCRRIFKPGTKHHVKCPSCNNPLYLRTSPNTLMRLLGRTQPEPIAKAVTPLRLLSRVLAYVVTQPGMETALDAWRSRTPPPPGEYHSIHDGKCWKTIKGSDSRPFFGPEGADELRIGVILHADGFQASTSIFSSSYSTGAISFSIPNLPPAVRYRVNSMILSALTDGPKEPDAEELQYWLELMVDDLLMLYHRGIDVNKRDSRPAGRCCRVALVCTCADHPAMCKVGGFADKGHNNAPCTQGTVKTADMFSDECLSGGCPPRTHEEHLRLATEWRKLEDPSERSEHFKINGARWSELLRLPYYDSVRMTVVDPMHNLLLGVAKNQWYACWIKTQALRPDTKAGTKRELTVLHEFLNTFRVPAWVGRLPMKVGEPAGGNLTADEYKLLITCVCPLLPLMWQRGLPEARKDHAAVLVKHKDDVENYDVAIEKHKCDLAQLEVQLEAEDLEPKPRTALEKKLSKLKKKTPVAPTKPLPRMREEEIPLMLKLATAIKLLLGSSTTLAQRERGSKILFEYLVSYKEIYGLDAMMPNHHFAAHIPDQLDLFGTVSEVWAFIAERLNLTLRSSNTNGRKGGLLEVSMMRAFYRNNEVCSIVEYIATIQKDGSAATEAIIKLARKMLHNAREARGTVEATAAIADTPEGAVRQDACQTTLIGIGEKSEHTRELEFPLRDEILKFYRANPPRTADPPSLFHMHDCQAPRDGPFLSTSAHTLSYVVLRARRITPLGDSSIVRVMLPNHGYLAGNVVRFLFHEQFGRPEPALFAEMQWMIPQDMPGDGNDPWAD